MEEEKPKANKGNRSKVHRGNQFGLAPTTPEVDQQILEKARKMSQTDKKKLLKWHDTILEERKNARRKFGDVREDDGYRFVEYSVKEHWISPQAWERRVKKARAYTMDYNRKRRAAMQLDK